VWSLDQGTDRIHIYDDAHQQVAVIDVSPAALRMIAPSFDPASGRTVPHMVDFDSEHRYAFIAATAGGATIVIDTVTREVVAVLETGPGTHMAAVTPDDRAVWVAVIGARTLVEIPLDLDAATPEFTVARTVDVESLLASTGFELPVRLPRLPRLRR
jgi:DNA-binding beta-propeller fold protein YncE